jgi:hypothetical protein
MPLAGIGPGMYGAWSIAAGAGLTGEPTMTRRATFPECSTTLNVGDEQRGEPIRCSNCRRALKISAFRVKDEAYDRRPASDGEGRNPAEVGDRRDGAAGPQTTPGTKRTTYLEGRPRRERRAGGVHVGVIGAAAAAALLLGLAVDGGVAYLHLNPGVAPVVVDASPAQRDAAPDQPAPQKPPDSALSRNGVILDRVPDNSALHKHADLPLLAQRQDPKRVPDWPAPQKKANPDLARLAHGRMQQHAAPAAEPAENQRWQYLVVSLPADVNQATDQLNGLAGDRWEYAGLISTSMPSVWIHNPLNHANEQVAAGHESSIVLRRPKIPFKVPGAIEGESLKITAKSGNFELQWQDTTAWVHGQWSGDRQLYASPLGAGDWADLALPAAAEGKYRITVYLTKSWNYGIIQFLINGTRLGKPIDGFNANTVVSTGAIDLGAANLNKGVNRLVVEVVGTNRMSAQAHYSWGLDCVVLTQE